MTAQLLPNTTRTVAETPGTLWERIADRADSIPDGYAILPDHRFNSEGRCINCHEERTTETYEEYVAWWYAHEYEGDPNHHPSSREDYAYVNRSCLGIIDD